VEEAADPTHPLHERFVWDDAEAGQRYRIEQARGLIQAVGEITVAEDGESYVTPHYVRDPGAALRQQGYISLADVPSRSQTARDVLAAEVDRIIALVDRAVAIAFAVGLADRMNDLREHAARVSEAVRKAPRGRPKKEAVAPPIAAKRKTRRPEARA
jgi:hypothetical protein